MNGIKLLQGLVDITNYLAEHDFTYNEAFEFVAALQNELSFSKDANEYDTTNDWYNKRPCCDIGRKIIVPLNKVDVRSMFFD